MKKLTALLACVFIWTATTAVTSTPHATFLKDARVKDFIKTMVIKYHFNEKELTKLIGSVTPRPKVIHSIKHPTEANPWKIYQRLFITPSRINEGTTFWRNNASTLAKAEKEFGVPSEIVVATIGIETNYFRTTGNIHVMNALVNLAFSPNYKSRNAFFQRELEEYLLLCREQGFTPEETLGSYAGAIGGSQFMPDSYRKYGLDYSNSGKVDLMHDEVDVIGSTANYYKLHGWKENGVIAIKAKVSGKGVNKLVANSRKHLYTLKQLKAAGVTPTETVPKDENKLLLIKLSSEDGAEYWIGLNNFKVIMSYNASYLYAMADDVLGKKLKESMETKK
jgi:membrane-bound lytic murein transglycosylase B